MGRYPAGKHITLKEVSFIHALLSSKSTTKSRDK